MAGTKKLTVVISQHQGKHPGKRQLEEELAMLWMMDPAVEVSIVPNLYDLSHDHSGMLFLRGIQGDVVVLGWMYPRAIRWTLDRAGIKGRAGTVLLQGGDEDDWEEPESEEPTGIGSLDVPKRLIYAIDFKASESPQDFIDEVKRISDESSTVTVDLMSWIQGSPNQSQMERYLDPKLVYGNDAGSIAEVADEEKVRRRWYPVIDYDRCTNCMECIDFCLFGVYGIDTLDRILVEEQDNCKKGCPACSRVCPENAIVFPLHKTPAIAGAAGDVANLKIDLSILFGAPEGVDAAIRERDVELVRDGRDAVGSSVGLERRQNRETPRDELDELMDKLDALEI